MEKFSARRLSGGAIAFFVVASLSIQSLIDRPASAAGPGSSKPAVASKAKAAGHGKPAESGPGTVGDDESVLRAQAKDYAKAFAAGDAQMIAAMWAEDGSYVDPEGRLFKGREAIQKLFASYFKQCGGEPMEVTVESISFPASNVAIERGSSRLSSRNTEGALSRYTAVHVKENGKWRMSNVIETECAPPSHYECLKDLQWLIGDWTAKGSPEKAMHCNVNWSANHNFIHCVYYKGGSAAGRPLATEIIGWNPMSRRLISWYFDCDGGFGQGSWDRDGRSWVVKSRAVNPDGTAGSASYLIRPLDANSFSWRSTRRSCAGRELDDTPEIVMARAQSLK